MRSFIIIFCFTFLVKVNSSIASTKNDIIQNFNEIKNLSFEFQTEEKKITITPGEIKTINYTVKNFSQKKMTGMATFQVYPSELKDYITKMNCFCYEEQTLKGGETEKYALVLLVDPNVTKNIKEAIIQFVYFKK